MKELKIRSRMSLEASSTKLAVSSDWLAEVAGSGDADSGRLGSPEIVTRGIQATRGASGTTGGTLGWGPGKGTGLAGGSWGTARSTPSGWWMWCRTCGCGGAPENVRVVSLCVFVRSWRTVVRGRGPPGIGGAKRKLRAGVLGDGNGEGGAVVIGVQTIGGEANGGRDWNIWGGGGTAYAGRGSSGTAEDVGRGISTGLLRSGLIAVYTGFSCEFSGLRLVSGVGTGTGLSGSGSGYWGRVGCNLSRRTFRLDGFAARIDAVVVLGR
jgi:hypothetical protein